MTTVPLTSPDRPPAVLRQTLALLHDAYRELNSKRMFWISLILSGVAMGAFGVIAVTKYGLTFAGYDWESSFIPPKSQYKFLFSSMMIDWWLTWAVLILAIISTAGFFRIFCRVDRSICSSPNRSAGCGFSSPNTSPGCSLRFSRSRSFRSWRFL